MIDYELGRRRWRERTGLVQLGTLPAQDAWSAVKRSLPRIQDAMRLVDLVESRLGDRVERDIWCTPNETCLLLRDPDRPGWYLPRRLIYFAVDIPPEPEPTFADSIPLEVQEAFKKARQGPEGVLPLPGARTGRLAIYEGDAYIDIRWNARGLFEQWSATRGDHTLGDNGEPFHTDPFLRPPPALPLTLLTRDDLDPQGHSLDELADMIAELKPEMAEKTRVYCPAVQPGMVIGAGMSGLTNLRRAAWDGRVSGEAGWVVIDGWNGTALAEGATFEEATAAWHELVRRVQPLPPVEPPPPPPPEEPFEEGSETTEKDGVTTHRMAMRIEIHPPRYLPWPDPRPENVPAMALPLLPAPEIPESLLRIGFNRVLRLFGDRGNCAFAFVRDEDRGFTLIGDEAVPALDLPTLDETLDRIDAEARADLESRDYFRERNQFLRPEYPIFERDYRAWDQTGRFPELASTSTGWSAGLGQHAWDADLRHRLRRVRYLQLGE